MTHSQEKPSGDGAIQSAQSQIVASQKDTAKFIKRSQIWYEKFNQSGQSRVALFVGRVVSFLKDKTSLIKREQTDYEKFIDPSRSRVNKLLWILFWVLVGITLVFFVHFLYSNIFWPTQMAGASSVDFNIRDKSGGAVGDIHCAYPNVTALGHSGEISCKFSPAANAKDIRFSFDFKSQSLPGGKLTCLFSTQQASQNGCWGSLINNGEQDGLVFVEQAITFGAREDPSGAPLVAQITNKQPLVAKMETPSISVLMGLSPGFNTSTPLFLLASALVGFAAKMYGDFQKRQKSYQDYLNQYIHDELNQFKMMMSRAALKDPNDDKTLEAVEAAWRKLSQRAVKRQVRRRDYAYAEYLLKLAQGKGAYNSDYILNMVEEAQDWADATLGAILVWAKGLNPDSGEKEKWRVRLRDFPSYLCVSDLQNKVLSVRMDWKIHYQTQPWNWPVEPKKTNLPRVKIGSLHLSNPFIQETAKEEKSCLFCKLLNNRLMYYDHELYKKITYEETSHIYQIIGETGVGKTALGIGLGQYHYGDEKALARYFAGYRGKKRVIKGLVDELWEFICGHISYLEFLTWEKKRLLASLLMLNVNDLKNVKKSNDALADDLNRVHQEGESYNGQRTLQQMLGEKDLPTLSGEDAFRGLCEIARDLGFEKLRIVMELDQNAPASGVGAICDLGDLAPVNSPFPVQIVLLYTGTVSESEGERLSLVKNNCTQHSLIWQEEEFKKLVNHRMNEAYSSWKEQYERSERSVKWNMEKPPLPESALEAYFGEDQTLWWKMISEAECNPRQFIIKWNQYCESKKGRKEEQKAQV